MAQWIVLERTLCLPPGLLEASYRKQVKVRVPLAHVPRDRFAGGRQTKPALRFFPIQIVRPGHNPQHAMRFWQVRIEVQSPPGEFARPRHRLIGARTGYC